NIDAFEEATIHIFDRWGEEVYQKTGYLNKWDGRNNNNDILPDGTYYYIIRFQNSDKYYSGTITLLRNK
ncbi:MAG: gliding motility-associated C-terminal domain-containing protein, partial [bacterium]